MIDTQEAIGKLQETVGQISNLPTPPVVFNQINKVINDPNTSAYDIAAILSEDPAMSVKVLKLSNSAFYGMKREITSIKQAIIIMGIEAVRSLVLSSAVFDMFKHNDSDPGFQDDFWRHSLATGTCARLLIRQMSGKWITEAELAFSAGLLHDIGKLVQYSYLPDDFKAAKEASDADNLPWYKAEELVLGYTHGHLGSLLGHKWKLPAVLRDAIENHHMPHLAGTEGIHASLVHIANYISHMTFDDEILMGRNDELIDRDVLTKIGLESIDLPNFRDRLMDEYAKAETFMKMARGG
jgi:putative nucleotidyltransferase with HDIG domain